MGLGIFGYNLSLALIEVIAGFGWSSGLFDELESMKRGVLLEGLSY